jgi:hypothetical protein
VWKRLAERQGANQDAEGEAAALAKPSRRELHARRVDAGERNAGEKSQGNDGFRGGRHQHRRVGGCAGKRAEKQQHAGVQDVGQVGDGTAERADDKSRLHGHGQPRRL